MSVNTELQSAGSDTGKMTKTISYYAAFVAVGLFAASLGPTLPGLAENTHSMLSEISFLFTARSFAYLIGSFLGGRLYDRVPGHIIMGSSLLLMVITMFLIPLTSLLWVLTMILLVLGIAEGSLDVGGNTLLVWIHGDKVGPYMNALHFFYGVGAFLSPIIIAWAVLVSGGITWAYWVLALLVLPVAIWLFVLRSPPIRSHSKNNPDVVVNNLLVVLIAIFFFLYVGAEVSFGGWIFTYVVSLGLATETSAAILTSMFWGAFTIGRLVGIPIAVRFRFQNILLADLMGCVCSLMIILIWSGSLLALFIGTFGIGFSMASIFPTTISLAERCMTITGKVIGWLLVGASAGGMTLPWLIGQVFESIGPQMTMVVLLIDLLIAMGVYVILIRRSVKPPWQKSISKS